MLVVRVQRRLEMAGVRARLGIGGGVLAAAALGCSFPAPEACALACGEDGACPGGFECQAQSQLCVPRGVTAACTPSVVLPNEPPDDGSDDAGLGGTGPGLGPEDGQAGGSGAGTTAGGGSGSAGAGGSGEGKGELAIVAVGGTQQGCAGVELGGMLRASGGVAPYAWRVIDAPPGVAAGASGEELELGGVPSQPGRLLVELADAAGGVVRSEVIVYERPEVALAALPAVCEGEGYSAELAAAGGDPAGYVWSAVLAPSDGAALTLEELGLRIEGSRLAGDLVASRDEAPLRLVVDVRDAHCRSSGVELELEIISSEGDECPSIQLADPPGEDALPAPCRGNFYDEALTVIGGEEPYVWSEVSAPPGLHFDVDTARVEGVPEADGVLTVEVTDGSSRTVQKSYDVATRDKCWVAFVASEPAPAHLELVDARLIERQPTARRTLPEEPALDAVVDFQFSPDGRFVAYRIDPSAPRLELGRLSNGRAQPLSFGGAVVAYAWSSDASTLAVVFAASGQSFLGAVDVSGVETTTVDPSDRLDGIRTLTAIAAPQLDSALAWYEPKRLGFLARDAGAQRRLVTAPLQQSRFAPPSLRGERDFSAGAALLAGPAGVFVAEPATGVHEFFPDGVESPTAHADGAIIAPSGAFAGLARGGALELYRPDRASGAAASPSLEARGCGALLAWASDRERIACSDPRGAGDRIAWFDVSAAGDTLTELAPSSDPYLYPSEARAGRRRAFSAKGRWFAFTTLDEVYVARLEPGPPRVEAVLPTAVLGLPASVLSFSPDESWLVVGAANTLGAIDLDQGRDSFRVLSPSAILDEFCSERFVDGRGAWCGNATREPDVSWSIGSDSIAFRSSLGTLQLIDLSRAREGIASEPISPDGCFEGCSSSSTARFQP